MQIVVPGVVVCVPSPSCAAVVVLDIGRFMLETIDQSAADGSLDQCTTLDQYRGELSSVQLSAAESSQQWEQLRDHEESEIKLLSRLELQLVLQKLYTSEGALTTRVSVTANSFELQANKDSLTRLHHIVSLLPQQGDSASKSIV